MNNTRPNKDYKIVTIQVAASAELSDSEITDGIGEMFRAAVWDGYDGPDPLVADWAFGNFVSKQNCDFPIVTTSMENKEGELFN
jgi:hypothetical protein